MTMTNQQKNQSKANAKLIGEWLVSGKYAEVPHFFYLTMRNSISPAFSDELYTALNLKSYMDDPDRERAPQPEAPHDDEVKRIDVNTDSMSPLEYLDHEVDIFRTFLKDADHLNDDPLQDFWERLYFAIQLFKTRALTHPAPVIDGIDPGRLQIALSHFSQYGLETPVDQLELIEKAARAHAQGRTQSASVPDGWKLVPTEPTDEMVDNAQPLNQLWPIIDRCNAETLREQAVRSYKRMLSASPTPPVTGSAQGWMTIDGAKCDQDTALKYFNALWHSIEKHMGVDPECADWPDVIRNAIMRPGETMIKNADLEVLIKFSRAHLHSQKQAGDE